MSEVLWCCVEFVGMMVGTAGIGFMLWQWLIDPPPRTHEELEEWARRK